MIANDILNEYGKYAPLLFALGLALIALGIVRKRRMTKRPTRPMPPAGAAGAEGLKASDVRAIASELNGLMVELHEASRRVAAQVDNRATKLEVLLQEADAKIARLEQLTGARGTAGAETRTAEEAERPATMDRAAMTRGAGGQTSAEVEASLPTHTQTRQIYELADQGKSPREIAQALNTHQGEIELILNLRGKVVARG